MYEQSITEHMSEVMDHRNKRSRNLKFLFMYPSADQYTQIIMSLCKYFNYTIPSPTSMKPLDNDLLNYTFIKPDKENDDSSTTLEIYTICNLKRSNALVSTLKPYRSEIDVFFFTDCNVCELTTLVNSYLEERENMNVKTYEAEKIIPAIYFSVHPILTNFEPNEITRVWKSYTILYTNVSKLSYNVITIPIVDFIQQFLRCLLLEYTINGQLMYFPYDIRNYGDKMNEFWNILFEDTNKKLQTIEASTNLNNSIIRYNEVFTFVVNDSIDKIEMVDDLFKWSYWQHFWIHYAEDPPALPNRR